MIVFTNVLSVYAVSQPGIASAYVINGISSPSVDDLQPIFHRLNQFLAPASTVYENITNILAALISIAPPPRRRNQSQGPLKKALRALGAALEVAMTLLGAESNAKEEGEGGFLCRDIKGGHIAVLLGGVPNYGPGGIPDNLQSVDLKNNPSAVYYRDLSKISSSVPITIHLFCCCNSSNFYIPILTNLVSNNGGTLIMHPNFGTEFKQDISKVFTRVIGRHGVFSISVSPVISVTHIIGPAVPYEASKKSKKDATQYCRITGPSPSNSFTIYFDVQGTKSYLNESAYFQFCTKYLTNQNYEVSRVINCTINLSPNVSTVIDSVDVNITAVLLAKKIVLHAYKFNLDPTEIAVHLDTSLKDLLTSCSTSTTKPQITIPLSLTELPRKIFHLRRGPILGHVLQHSDDIAYLRHLFLYSTYEEALHLMEPQLLLARLSEGAVTFARIPTEDLALQSNNILLFDNHTHIFVWYGSNINKDDPNSKYILSKCMDFVALLSQNRIPCPRAMCFQEGSSECRWLACRLIPSHKDEREQQIANFPLLIELDESDRVALMRKFHHSDDNSFLQYFRGLWN